MKKEILKKTFKHIGRIAIAISMFFLGSIVASGIVHLYWNRVETENIITKGLKGKVANQMIKSGDTIVYKWFVDSCREDSNSRFSRYLPYSIIMAERHNYLPAYYDVYIGLRDLYDPRYKIGKPDSLTLEMALCFLITGATKGDTSSIKELNRLNIPFK